MVDLQEAYIQTPTIELALNILRNFKQQHKWVIGFWYASKNWHMRIHEMVEEFVSSDDILEHVGFPCIISYGPTPIKAKN